MYDLTKRFNNDILVKILGTTSKFKKNYLILNKIDLVSKKSLLDTSQNINANVKFLETFMVSAKKKKGLDHLIEKISLQMPKRNWKFRKDTITDKTMNFQISEIYFFYHVSYNIQLLIVLHELIFYYDYIRMLYYYQSQVYFFVLGRKTQYWTATATVE